MSLRYKHGSAREGIQQLLAELRSDESPLKTRNLLLYVLSNKWFTLIDLSLDPPRSVSVGSYNEFTFRYTIQTSGCDSRRVHHVEVVLDHKNERYFRESGTLLTSLELLNKMISSMTME
jgi:hypothetical protein